MVDDVSVELEKVCEVEHSLEDEDVDVSARLVDVSVVDGV